MRWQLNSRGRHFHDAVARVARGMAAATVGLLIVVAQGRAYTIHSLHRPSATFRFLSRAKLSPTPEWPGYLSPRIRGARLWDITNIAGVDATDPVLDGAEYGPTAYAVSFGYRVTEAGFAGYGGASFSRTDPKALARLIKWSRRGFTPRQQRLGGHRVTEFRPGSTSTCWSYHGAGGNYVFCSKDFGGPPLQTIGKMIASMRPVTRLSVPRP